jgi:hypothetical protein
MLLIAGGVARGAPPVPASVPFAAGFLAQAFLELQVLLMSSGASAGFRIEILDGDALVWTLIWGRIPVLAIGFFITSGATSAADPARTAVPARKELVLGTLESLLFAPLFAVMVHCFLAIMYGNKPVNMAVWGFVCRLKGSSRCGYLSLL